MNGIVSVSCLGQMGRFGNQLWQYSVARKYAEIANCHFETPDWIGEKLFNISHRRVSTNLHRLSPDHLPWTVPNVDVYGYFQFQDAAAKLRRSEIKEWFKFKQNWIDMFPKKRPFYAAVHVRRGDYVSQYSDKYCVISDKSYTDAISQYGINPADVIFVREDSPEIIPSLQSEGLGFLPDFMTLMNADIILRANSTFSWWAAVLSNAKIYSPVVEARTGHKDVKFVEGNWPRLGDVANLGGKITDIYLPE